MTKSNQGGLARFELRETPLLGERTFTCIPEWLGLHHSKVVNPHPPDSERPPSAGCGKACGSARTGECTAASVEFVQAAERRDQARRHARAAFTSSAIRGLSVLPTTAFRSCLSVSNEQHSKNAIARSNSTPRAPLPWWPPHEEEHTAVPDGIHKLVSLVGLWLIPETINYHPRQAVLGDRRRCAARQRHPVALSPPRYSTYPIA